MWYQRHLLVLSHCVDSRHRCRSGGCCFGLAAVNEISIQESNSGSERSTHEAAASVGVKPIFSSCSVVSLEVIASARGSSVCDILLLVESVSTSSHF